MLLSFSSLSILHLYLVGVFLFLIIIGSFIIKDTINIIYINLWLYKRNFILDTHFCNDLDLTLFTSNLVQKKQWLFSLSILEFCGNKNLCNNYQISQILGYCYEQLNYTDIAEYYYTKSLADYSSNIDVLSRLMFIYKNDGKKDKMIDICKKLLEIDPTNVLAKKCL